MYGGLDTRKAGEDLSPDARLTGAPATPFEVDFPVTFDGTVGLYRQPDADALRSDTAVLFVSSWGFEEFCARKLWRLLAGELAGNGMASLRFDYPGTGDALDLADETAGLDVWHRSILVAAAHLKALSGARRLLLIGHGIGASLAWRAAEEIGDVAGVAMMAPALSGRMWIREFMALSRIADHGLIEHATPPTGPTMGEQTIPDGILSGLRAVDCRTPATCPVSNVFLLSREGKAAESAFLRQIEAFGAKTQFMPFDEYADFTRDVLFSVPPRAAISALGTWAAGIAKPQPTGTSRPNPVPPATPLTGEGFSETPVRFGENNRLYGILCRPSGPQRGATVMILSTGYDRMAGWGRVTARVCRDLAAAGIPTFRFDFANIADSPPQPGAPDQIIYNDSQVRDVDAALTYLAGEQMLPVVATGRCSGGYTAFKSAAIDTRIRAVIAVNVFDFHIDPAADVDKIISASLQPLSSYGKKMRSGGFWRRVLQREVDAGRGIRNLSKMVVGKIKALSLPVLVKLPVPSAKRRVLLTGFKDIEAKGTRMAIAYTEGDVGIPTLEAEFGKRGYLLKDFVDIDIDVIAGGDHNLTTAAAREYWRTKLEGMALQAGLPRDASRS